MGATRRVLLQDVQKAFIITPGRNLDRERWFGYHSLSDSCKEKDEIPGRSCRRQPKVLLLACLSRLYAPAAHFFSLSIMSRAMRGVMPVCSSTSTPT